CYQESLRLYDGLGDSWGHGQAYELISRSRERHGDVPGAAAACDRALEIVRERKDRWSEQRLLGYRGRLALRLGRPEEAEALLGDSVRQAEELGYCAEHLEDMV